MTNHLDIGCGKRPRNPYNRDIVWGVDISESAALENGNIKLCNVALDPIPFEDAFFDSVSAYDFLEHLPRMLINNGSVRFPVVEFMNEVWRVLKPGGLFYAVTPAYPRQEVFVDPTHINVITEKTHEYFTAPHYLARMYGFEGHFIVRRIRWVRLMRDYEPYNPTLSQRFKRFKDRIKGRMAHFMWEFEKISA
ncbi:MAG: class I SAM-dependent methyltransferase [Sulfurimonas sp.]|nr:class I SAM-dependent methyltransferase [Sulfurimonas sp.]